MRTTDRLLRYACLGLLALTSACGDDNITAADTRDSAADTIFDVDTAVDTAPDTSPNDTAVDSTPNDTGADTGSDTTLDTGDTGGDTTLDTAGDTGPDTTADTEDTTADTQDTAADTEDTVPDTEEDAEDTTPDTADTDDTAADTEDTADTEDAEDTGDAGDTSDTGGGTIGESCFEPNLVTLPATWTNPVVVSGDTTERADDYYVLGDECVGLPWDEGVGAADEVWSFTAPSAGTYTITLVSNVADLGLYALTSCSIDAIPECAGGSDVIGVGEANADVLTLDLAAAATVFVHVDAYSDEATLGESGAYTLTFAPPKARESGDQCANARTLTLSAGEYRGSGSTGLTAPVLDDYTGEACGGDPAGGYGDGGKDEVWRFVAPSAGSWTVTVTPSDASDPLLYAFDGTTCDGTCTGPAIDVANSGEVEALFLGTLAQGDAVSIVVDTWIANAGGAYDIAVSACSAVCVAGECGGDNGCGGVCGCGAGEVCNAGGLCESESTPGNSCDNPMALAAGVGGSLSGDGDLAAIGLSDEVTTGSCALLGDDSIATEGAGTVDETWTFEVASDGTYHVAVTSDVGADVFYTLYFGPGCDDTACVGYVDNGADGGVDTFDHALFADTTYTLVVDSWATFAAGAYSISITKACEPLCALGECDVDDGCGGTCGCGFGEICDVGFCLDNTGDTCLAPYPMFADSSGEYAEFGDLASATVGDDHSVESCELLDGVENSGRGTPDEIFTFDVAIPGNYRVEVLSDLDADVFFALFKGDLCGDASCLGQVDNGLDGEIDSWVFTLAAGPYTLLIDTFDVLAAGEYLIVISPAATTSEQCAADLFFSEYVEAGEGSNKALEIYNGTGHDVDLADYQIWRANNGALVAAGGKFALKKDAATPSPVLSHGETWVVCHGSSDAALKAACDQDAGSTELANFNGDDFIGLVRLDPTPGLIDAIGEEGVDPGASWPVDDMSTQDHVLVRKPVVTEGNPDWTTGASEWTGFPAATLDDAILFSDLGFHDYFWECTAP